MTKYDRLIGERGTGAGKFDVRLDLDHLTLDAGFGSWHTTEAHGTGRTVRQGGGKTLPLGEERRLWLLVTVRSSEELRELKRETDVWVTPPPGIKTEEARRRLDAFVSRTTPQTARLRMKGGAPFVNSLLVFAVIVAPAGAPRYEGRLPLPPPYEPHAIFEPGDPVSFYYEPVRLSPRSQLQFATIWVPGRMQTGVYLSGHGPNSFPSGTFG